MNVPSPFDLEQIAKSPRPMVALVRLIATAHPKYVRKRRSHYAESASMSVGELNDLLDAIESWLVLVGKHRLDLSSPAWDLLNVAHGKVTDFEGKAGIEEID